ncbi:hypothetical protein RB595_006142 [Gaeumannomyces hyphopodioides]
MRTRAQPVFAGFLLLILVAATALSATPHHGKIPSPPRASNLPTAIGHIRSKLVRRTQDVEQIETCRRTCLQTCGHEHNLPYEYSNCLNHCYVNTVECRADQDVLENWNP